MKPSTNPEFVDRRNRRNQRNRIPEFGLRGLRWL